MDDGLISVIMSTYNETENELKSSIYSILNQTYSNIEFIIVNDNPENKLLGGILSSFKDPRIRILNNRKNHGLVYSLNYAWKQSNGNIIVRMDADDICVENRIEKQFDFMKNGDYDLLGCDIKMINGTQSVLHFPITNVDVKKFIPWFNCIAHPTWMIKKSLYERLGGYRNIPYCEDYDFILRCIDSKYKIGNLPEIGLIYRIRENSISNKNNVEQYLISRYLASNRKRISKLSEEDIRKYRHSYRYKKKQKKYISYCVKKNQIKNKKLYVVSVFSLLSNPYFYMNILEKYEREKLKKNRRITENQIVVNTNMRYKSR